MDRITYSLVDDTVHLGRCRLLHLPSKVGLETGRLFLPRARETIRARRPRCGETRGGAEASIASKEHGKYTLAVAFGSLKLPAGGLSVDGVVCEKAVDLSAGQSLSFP